MSAPWWQRPHATLDTETTGIDVRTDRIVTASFLMVEPGRRPYGVTKLLNPGIDIPAEATAVHGISTERAQAEGADPVDVLDALAGDVALALRNNVPVCGFNLVFDISILENELRRHELPTLADRLDGRVRPLVDSMVLDKATSRRKGSRKLVDQCAHHKVLLGGAHEASADALAAARLAVVLVKGNASLSSMTLDELHDAQVAWRREQSESFQKYLARQGKRQHICPCWPICECPDEPAEAAS